MPLYIFLSSGGTRSSDASMLSCWMTQIGYMGQMIGLTQEVSIVDQRIDTSARGRSSLLSGSGWLSSQSSEDFARGIWQLMRPCQTFMNYASMNSQDYAPRSQSQICQSCFLFYYLLKSWEQKICFLRCQFSSIFDFQLSTMSYSLSLLTRQSTRSLISSIKEAFSLIFSKIRGVSSGKSLLLIGLSSFLDNLQSSFSQRLVRNDLFSSIINSGRQLINTVKSRTMSAKRKPSCLNAFLGYSSSRQYLSRYLQQSLSTKCFSLAVSIELSKCLLSSAKCLSFSRCSATALETPYRSSLFILAISSRSVGLNQQQTYLRKS